MGSAIESSLEELNAADARRAALAYLSEAFAEALLDGVGPDAFAEVALCAAMRELVAAHGEEWAACFATSLAERAAAGEFSSAPRQ
jgi:hypothetical protein